MAKPKPSLPWLPPGTPSTRICPNGHINPATNTSCWKGCR
ncbi:hypothetical protein HD595_006795 [Nonomuraea roseoviolacea subsp. carminata]|uniref:Uncharacterized protein n=1 Tax=Nonomuraea roseoviolacea subsp. carminata TaxID=160689 RepID=A0ABT1K9H7_9ACTN|nr:hypothetical protein [Nonomuraea roseoviolacea subsp. carminata]